MTEYVTMYTTSWCGYCIRLKGQLRAAGIEYREIDIESDPAAAATVQQINGGHQTVPTVVLPGGRSMINPSVRQIREVLG